jgi:ABC-2 type transport system permease protein
VIRPTVALARRALRNALRRPQFLAPLVLFPTLFLAVNVGGLNRTTALPGFPQVDGFLDFQLAAAMTQSLLLGGVSTGIATALEIEGGFFDRLVSSPVPRLALVLGRLVAAAVISAVQILYFLVVGLIFGASIQGGVAGAAVVLLIGVVAGVGFAAIGQAIALRARSASTVQGIFPIVFVILFVSSAFFPRDLLESPLDVVARYNPLSYISDGMRGPIIEGIEGAAVLEGLAAAALIAVAATVVSIVALRGKLRSA